ncbi:uncharacterized protein [Panulirus ornatus]|uniref:uncharacterized protein isoform X2 n=1 Tax=Panulirus ornatus TaxID=150431 RepID=UPI003A8A8986
MLGSGDGVASRITKPLSCFDSRTSVLNLFRYLIGMDRRVTSLFRDLEEQWQPGSEAKPRVRENFYSYDCRMQVNEQTILNIIPVLAYPSTSLYHAYLDTQKDKVQEPWGVIDLCSYIGNSSKYLYPGNYISELV